MALTVRKITLWRREVANHPGMLADVLEPLAAAGASLRIVMGYRFPNDQTMSAIELFPVAGRAAIRAAAEAGLAASPIPCLLVEGDDRPGLGARMARAVAAQGINIAFLMAETIGRKFSAVFGFDSDADAVKASAAIRRAGTPPRR